MSTSTATLLAANKTVIHPVTGQAVKVASVLRSRRPGTYAFYLTLVDGPMVATNNSTLELAA